MTEVKREHHSYSARAPRSQNAQTCTFCHAEANRGDDGFCLCTKHRALLDEIVAHARRKGSLRV